MKSLTKSIGLALFAAFVLFACKPDAVTPRDSDANNDRPVLNADAGPHILFDPICSGVTTAKFLAGTQVINPITGQPFGAVEIYNGIDGNGENKLGIDYRLGYGWFAGEVEIYVGPASGVTYDSNGVPQFDPATWERRPINPVVNSWFDAYDMGAIGTCEVVVARLTVGQLGWGSPDFIPGSERTLVMVQDSYEEGTAPTSADYKVPFCYEACETCERDFTTYNQCAYGLCGQDGPAADLRDQLFTTAFPNGLSLGCATGYNLTLNSSAAVNDFLPAKGGKLLTSNMTNPTGRFVNPNDKICPGYGPAECSTIDFETDGVAGGNGTALLAGTYITNQYDEIGLTISGVSKHSGRTGDVIIFDSSNPTGGDWDLGTPNENYGGPGRGAHGTNPLGMNNVAEGNIIILAENVNDYNNDGRVDNPDDDAAGGVIYFDFAQPTNVNAITLVDLDDHANNNIILQFEDGTQQTWSCPQIGNNSRKVVDLSVNGAAAQAVVRISVSFSGSGAIGGLDICTPGELSNNACINDGAGFASTLAGRLAAATMNVEFDKADPNMGGADFQFGKMVVRTGPFQGMTVNEVLVEANNVLGGCSSNFTKQQVNGALRNINNSFRDGVRQNNYLVCP